VPGVSRRRHFHAPILRIVDYNESPDSDDIARFRRPEPFLIELVI
jgi:hypothetical protein